MKRRIMTLSENTAGSRPRGLLAEWGLSVLVESGDARVLLDTGASVSAVHNGDLLGVEWPAIDAVVLSHGHYDHTGGLRDVLRRISKPVSVVAHPEIWAAKYVQGSAGERLEHAGVPFARAELESLGAKFHLTAAPVWLSDRVVTSGEIPMITGYEVIDPKLCEKRGDRLSPDTVADDQALFVKTDRGLAVVLGCAHRGVVNTLRHARSVTGVDRIWTVVGGMHLIRASEEQIERTIADLKDLGVERLGVSHCTGMPATVRLAREFGMNFFFNHAGSIVEL